MGQNQAAEIGDRQRIAIGSAFSSGMANRVSGEVALGVPAGLDRRELRRLIFERVQAMRVAEEELQRNQYGQEPSASRASAGFFDEAPQSQIPGRDADDHETRGDVNRDDDVREPKGKDGLKMICSQSFGTKRPSTIP